MTADSTTKRTHSSATDVASGTPVWFAFGQKRRLYLPAGSQVAQRYALRFFVWRSWQRWAMRLQLSAGLPRKVKINNEGWDALSGADLLTKQLAIKSGLQCQIFTAIRNGSFGPFQKTSLRY